MKIPNDDPRLTDYALGEMDDGSRKKFEAAMADDPSTFDEIHEIRSSAAALGESVAAKPALRLTDTQRHRILRLAAAPAPLSISRPDNIVRPAFWNWFGKFAAGTAAAGIAVAALYFAYQSGYKSGVVEKASEQNPEKGSVSKGEPLPGETPSIRITVVDDAGESRPSSRPINADSIIPVREGREDVYVAAVPKVRTPEPPETESGDPVSPPGEEIGPDPRIGAPLVAGNPTGSSSDDTGSVASGVMENQFVEVSSSPRSSFPLRAAPDAYADAVGAIRGTGQLPDPATVAVEQIVNAFTYRVPGYVPTSTYKHPFAAGAEVFSCPWNPENRLVRVTVSAFGRKSVTAEEQKSVAENIELLVEFNRTRAARYRLIGFDGAGLLSAVSDPSTKSRSRSLSSGETITALYEVVPAKGVKLEDDHRYSPHNFAAPPRDHARELLCLSISYTRPDVADILPAHTGTFVAPVIDPGLAWNRSSGDFQFAAATAAFGMVLSGSEHVGDFGFAQIETLATRALRRESDRSPERDDFLKLVGEAVRISDGL